MFTDMVGYTALGQRNEPLSLEVVEGQKKNIRAVLNYNNGREVNTMGDAFLVEFSSALEAVRCAYEIQKAIRESNFSLPEERRVLLRIGIHLGDVVESKGDISGDAVNVASKIEPLAEGGGVLLSRQVYDDVQNKFDLPLVSFGIRTLKSVNKPMEVFKMIMPWETRLDSVPPDIKRIAILPFANVSSDPNDSYFADGVTDELISTISGISGLHVISRTSVMGYKGANKKVPEIAQELKVGSILEGSVRKAESFIRVTAQLIDVQSDRPIWSQSFDRELKNIFALQSEIAKHVAESLRVKILSEERELIEKKSTDSTEAYSLYLKGRVHWNKRGIDDTKKAMEYFQLSVHEDPDFVMGYVGLADCHIMLRSNWSLDREANLEKAKAMIAKALKLGPGLAEAHATNAIIIEEEYHLREAEEELRRAIELKPNYASAHQWLGNLLVTKLKFGEALEHIEKALELDPLSPMINVNHGQYYLAKRDYGRALQPLKRGVELGFPMANALLVGAYGQLKMLKEMKREATIFGELVHDTYPLVQKGVEAYIAYYEGDNKTLRGLLPLLEAHLEESITDAYEMACFYFHLGENDKGFEWLEKSYSRKEGHLMFLRTDWYLDGVRDDPRYLQILKKIELE